MQSVLSGFISERVKEGGEKEGILVKIREGLLRIPYPNFYDGVSRTSASATAGHQRKVQFLRRNPIVVDAAPPPLSASGSCSSIQRAASCPSAAVLCYPRLRRNIRSSCPIEDKLLSTRNMSCFSCMAA